MEEILKVDNKSPEEIENLRVERLEALSEAQTICSRVEQERLLIQRGIIDLQGKKKDLEIAESKAKHIIRKLNNEIEYLKSKFWSVKNT